MADNLTQDNLTQNIKKKRDNKKKKNIKKDFCKRIIITGIVQGVGFRPTLFNFLRTYDIPLSGTIQNTGNLGVTIDLYLRLRKKKRRENENDFNWDKLVEEIKKAVPPMSYIEEIKAIEIPEHELKEYIPTELKIIQSNPGIGKGLTLPPDISICDDCVKELNNPSMERFYQYPFIACASCGPRFTIMKTLPYDRENSTMDEFPFCKGLDSCEADYYNFNNRRFHAQTFSCKKCGPHYFSIDEDNPEEAWQKLIKALRKGKIAAVKGIGGVNLITRADIDESVIELRNRKKDRKYKPFAIMVPSVQIARRYVEIPKEHEKILTSFRKPIVLFRKKKTKIQNNNVKFRISDFVAPSLEHIGIILPYMGLHYMLFKELGEIPLIFTSGNVSNLPMAIDNEKIIDELKDLADIFYLHNRTIWQRCDDSVMKIVCGKYNPIRRSRGFVPEYYRLPFNPPYSTIIATGAELNSTGAVSKGNRVFPTQHIGNVRSLETYEFLDSALKHLLTLLKIKEEEIGSIAHDAHPAFLSTRLANEWVKKIENKNLQIKREKIYHHHAHAVSLMVDHYLQIESKIIAITVDGVGYGKDKQPWGGEILLVTYKDFKRKGYLYPIPMIGGDRCAKYPARMLLNTLLSSTQIYSKNMLLKKLINNINFIKAFPLAEQEINHIIKTFDKNKIENEPINTKQISFNDIKKKYPNTSSLGRWFDSCAALLNICYERTYRGEPAMKLEGKALQIIEKIEDLSNKKNIIRKSRINQQHIDEIIIIKKEYLDVTSELDYFFQPLNNYIDRNQILANNLLWDAYILYFSIKYRKNLLSDALESEIQMKLENNIDFKKRYQFIDTLIQNDKICKNKKIESILAYLLIKNIARLFALQAIHIALEENITKIGVSGGVAYNEIFISIVKNEILKNKLEFVQHSKIAPGDAGISIGQIAICAARAIDLEKG